MDDQLFDSNETVAQLPAKHVQGVLTAESTWKLLETEFESRYGLKVGEVKWFYRVENYKVSSSFFDQSLYQTLIKVV